MIYFRGSIVIEVAGGVEGSTGLAFIFNTNVLREVLFQLEFDY